jgi:hypothetical protein
MKDCWRCLCITLVAGMVSALGGHELYAAPGNGILFGTDASGGDLITIDPTTGAGTIVGPMGVGPVPSLAVDPITGIMYAGGGAGLPFLYTVNSTTGAATLVGDTGLGLAAIGALDFRADGTLFAAVNIAGNGGTGSDHLATIDKLTGVATVIGPFGTCTGVVVPSEGDGSCTIEGMEAIAFSPGGVLFGAVTAHGAAGAPGLYTIDTTTGAATFVAPILDSSDEPPSGGIASLQFTCGGILYGGTASPLSAIVAQPSGDGGNLVTIDPTTGLFVTIGNAVPSGQSLGALAFGSLCGGSAAPAASTLGLVLLVVSLLGIAALTLPLRRAR